MTSAVLDRKSSPHRTTLDDVFASSPHSRQVMRQTQALMGAVLLAGCGAAYLVSMSWVAVPLVVGLGLMIAGMSGVCPMASLISRLPWNRAAEAEHGTFGGGCCGSPRT